MWRGNPTYNARVFNPATGSVLTGQFLYALKDGGSTPMSQRTGPLAQSSDHQGDIIPGEGPGDDGIGGPTDTLATAASVFPYGSDFLMKEYEPDEEEEDKEEDKEEEEACGEKGGGENAAAVEGHGDRRASTSPTLLGVQGDHMLVDEQLASEDHGVNQKHQVSHYEYP